jgi:hypothetical protein
MASVMAIFSYVGVSWRRAAQSLDIGSVKTDSLTAMAWRFPKSRPEKQAGDGFPNDQ